MEPVTDRLLVLQGVRLLTALALPVITAITGNFDVMLIPLALAYAAVIGAVGAARRQVPRLDRSLVSSMVLVDGLVLALAVAQTGGTGVHWSSSCSCRDRDHAPGVVPDRARVRDVVRLLLVLSMRHPTPASSGPSRRVSDRFALVSAATFLLLRSPPRFLVGQRTVLRHSAQLEWLVELSTDLEQSHRAEDGGDARPACADGSVRPRSCS